MPVNMAEHQLAFWQELLSPFPDHLLSTTPRGGKELTYVDKRAITNRLDSVCGPNGWFPEYDATARGYKCRLSILVPTVDPDRWIFMHKEDGAGFEEMGSYNKSTKEWEPDVDNDEKSGYTNALRRAAQDAWGIGRYLYRKGIPTFLDPNAKPFEDGPVLAPRAPTEVRTQAAEVRTQAAEVRTQAPRVDPNPTPIMPVGEASPRVAAPAAQPAASGQKQYDNFKIPRSGKQVFPWCCEMEKAFETDLRKGMGREGEDRGWGSKFSEWTEEQAREICMTAIQFCRELPTYKGQYEYLFPGGSAPAVAPATVRPGVNIADLRRAFMEKLKGLLGKQLDREATQAEMKSTFEQIAAASETGEGHTGEVPESLSKMSDVKWLTNMIKFTDNQIALAVALPEDDDIPF